MKLDFSKLSPPIHKKAGTTGTTGTINAHAGSSRPQDAKRCGDTWGHSGPTYPLPVRTKPNLSPMSPSDVHGWGHRKPAPSLVVPVVPNVPEKNDEKRNTFWQSDLVREFMAVDGLSFAEATAMAAISVQPRPAAEWMALITDLDRLVEAYCAAYKLSEQAQARILDVRRRQSLASIPASILYFQNSIKEQDHE